MSIHRDIGRYTECSCCLPLSDNISVFIIRIKTKLQAFANILTSMSKVFDRDMFLFWIVALQFFLFPVKTEVCELTSDKDIQFTASQFFQSRQYCSLTGPRTTNARRITITGRLVDYPTHCENGINNANIEILHLRPNIHSICRELYHPNAHGYFNVTTTVVVPLNEEILLRVTALGYKTTVKQASLSSVGERSEDSMLNWQIALTTDARQIQSQQPMKSMVDDLISNMTLEEKLGQLNFAELSLNSSVEIIIDNVS